VLDVGCGTGTHDLLLAAAGCAVRGLDLDEGSIEIAHSKSNSSNLSFSCQDIASLDEMDFDAAVILFNVINYIGDPHALRRFFSAIAERITPGATYVFDCWNGLAALIDPPRDKRSEIQSGGDTIVIETRPTIDLMNQTVRMANRVTVTNDRGTTSTFNYDYNSYLWTPWQLRNLLQDAGLEVDRIATWTSPQTEAGASDWKVLFVCHRGKR